MADLKSVMRAVISEQIKKMQNAEIIDETKRADFIGVACEMLENLDRNAISPELKEKLNYVESIINKTDAPYYVRAVVAICLMLEKFK